MREPVSVFQAIPSAVQLQREHDWVFSFHFFLLICFFFPPLLSILASFSLLSSRLVSSPLFSFLFLRPSFLSSPLLSSRLFSSPLLLPLLSCDCLSLRIYRSAASVTSHSCSPQLARLPPDTAVVCERERSRSGCELVGERRSSLFCISQTFIYVLLSFCFVCVLVNLI